MDGAARERQLRWLMVLRVVTVTTLLVSVLAVELLLGTGGLLRPLFALAALAYGMVLLYAVLDRWFAGRDGFVWLQLVGDALVISGFVGITGGMGSPMSFLYLVPVLLGAVSLYRRGALGMAAACWLCYAVVATSGFRWPMGGGPALGGVRGGSFELAYALLVHAIAFGVVGWLGAYLAERLRLTGRQLAERSGAVARLQALNENIIESIQSGLITTDLEGRIRFVNRGAVELTGFPPERWLGEPVHEFFGCGEEFLAQVRAALRTQRRVRIERRFRRADGVRILLGIAASQLFDRAQRPLGLIFIFQDLTEIEALEREVRLKERMAALGEMAAGMAHELRNPLAAIRGAVQYLGGQLPQGDEARELMEIILRESERLEHAIRDFLTFARPGRFAPERTDLARLLEQNVRLLQKSPWCTARHRIELDCATQPLWCEVDPNRMKQVFWNLSTNALKAMPGGGRLRIAVAPAGDEEVEIAFIDEGRGMNMEELEHYFQPFRSGFDEGTGLGTAIVFRLVQEHRGKVDVASEPGAGTTVRVRLPRRTAACPTAYPAAAAGGRL